MKLRQHFCTRGLFVLLTFFKVLSAAEDGSPSVRIATYNLKNYTSTDRRVDDKWLRDYPKPESEKAAIRRQIVTAGADLLFVQEIGGFDYLEELRQDLLNEGIDYPFAGIVDGEDSVRRIGYLSKVEPLVSKSFTDLQFNYHGREASVKRGMLALTIPIGKQPLTLFGVHLKSRYTTDKDDPKSKKRRAKEATACRDAILREMDTVSAVPYLVCGDFNDHVRSPAWQRFQTKGRQTIGRRIPAEDDAGLTWTYHYIRELRYETIDGFVASPEFELTFLVSHAKILGDLRGQPIGSDHRLVYIDLERRETEEFVD